MVRGALVVTEKSNAVESVPLDARGAVVGSAALSFGSALVLSATDRGYLALVLEHDVPRNVQVWRRDLFASEEAVVQVSGGEHTSRANVVVVFGPDRAVEILLERGLLFYRGHGAAPVGAEGHPHDPVRRNDPQTTLQRAEDDRAIGYDDELERALAPGERRAVGHARETADLGVVQDGGQHAGAVIDEPHRICHTEQG